MEKKLQTTELSVEIEGRSPIVASIYKIQPNDKTKHHSHTQFILHRPPVKEENDFNQVMMMAMMTTTMVVMKRVMIVIILLMVLLLVMVMMTSTSTDHHNSSHSSSSKDSFKKQPQQLHSAQECQTPPQKVSLPEGSPPDVSSARLL